MTPLGQMIAARIAAAGPMTLADYMQECLLHPEHGYYTTREPFGAAGDFITAPEISQMFGELLGLSLAQAWLDQGAPDAFCLAELGPGRGTLMADILRATWGVPGFHAAMRVWLIEASPRLQGLQRASLAGYKVEWGAEIADLPALPLFLVANEFFDALPIRQFQRQGGGWCERMVGLVSGALGFGLAPEVAVAGLAGRLPDVAQGEVVEICPSAGPIMAEIGGRIAGVGGAALIVDYGGWQSRGDTFQAVKSNAYADPFAEPGQADLTAHVDFAALALWAGTPYSYATQGEVLQRLGIVARSARLAQRLSGAALAAHEAATRRLTDPAEMGSLFKVLALHPKGAAPLPGMV